MPNAKRDAHEMQLFFDARDDKLFEQRGMRNLYWLDDLGAKPIQEAKQDDEGFLFAGARCINDYKQLVQRTPNIFDYPDDRQPLIRLESVLHRLDENNVATPRPKTWLLRVDQPIPKNISFPLFVRAGISSWKLGGKISKVTNQRELESEAGELRRAFGWDELILARQWLDIVDAGQSMYGPIPLEIRTWIIDQVPYAWSFHHVHAAPNANGFPLTKSDLSTLNQYAADIGRSFTSRLVCADFVRLKTGEWNFLEAGPGSCAGTGHEQVYKAVASKLIGQTFPIVPDDYGNTF